jgi:maltose phosphorylase
MKTYLKHHEWEIVEEGFDPHVNMISESVFSIGNGRMGQRANFEEFYSGPSLQGSYVAGVYYPDKTRVGWWKNGYPEYFAKVLNAPSWIDILVTIGKVQLDLATCKIENFKRVLDMRNGILSRSFIATFPDGKRLAVQSKRFCSMHHTEIGAIEYALTPINFSGVATITLGVDANVVNKDSNYDEEFWEEVDNVCDEHQAIVIAQTKKTFFHVATGTCYTLRQDNQPVEPVQIMVEQRSKYAASVVQVLLTAGKEIVINKYAAVISSENHPKEKLRKVCVQVLTLASDKKFETLMAEHAEVWKKRWETSDIIIDGDVAAQQGIRFNIFQLIQTYTGEDARLNIGPKGFTGEKYGGSTYWDTEAYCVPFYLYTHDATVAKNLLLYRYKHLPKAIENAKKLGFKDGAAFYPFVTMNGEECHNEWEITFEEIHRTSAMAYAIRDYIEYTQDKSYLATHGLEVLIGISRFWEQRVSWSADKSKYVILGVTGPNEYENNVNNNWYTNYLCTWTLRFTLDSLAYVKQNHVDVYKALLNSLQFNEEKETTKWKAIIDQMYYPADDRRGIFLQQDGFLDKVLMRASDLSPSDRPLNQNWSWDRILRSCFIKQADVLQGLYLFEDEFDIETIRKNYDFYEPMTVHESSLSPCVHVILAAKLGYKHQAYALYLRTARLDLDDYNNDTEDGCHITSMAGTWMSIVKGFGGMRVRDGKLHFNPFIPDQWKSYSFNITYHGRTLRMLISQDEVTPTLISGEPIDIFVKDKIVQLT